MIEPKPHPTRRTHWLASLARWSLGLTLASWLVVAAVWGVLHLWIVPRISEWRPELESLASRTLGVPVTIGNLQAHNAGVIPTFELSDVVLHDPSSGSEALQLSKVVVAVSAHSLMTLGVEQIYIDAPELTVRRAANGQIFIAGIAVSAGDKDNTSDADWIFSQPEIALRHGKVEWVDEMLQAPPLQLDDVDLVIRNKVWRHSLRLDATPPKEWGQRFTVMGSFKEPLLSVHEGRIDRWSGQIFADLEQVDLSQLGQYISPKDWKLQQGRGAVRAWVEVGHGQPMGAVADVSIEALQVQWKDKPEPLQLQSLQGRMSLRDQNGYSLSVQGLSFTTGDGLHWPQGNFSVSYSPTGASEQGAQGEHGEVQADGIDLAIAAQLLQRLPVPPELQTKLQAVAPGGLLHQLKLSWRGPVAAPAQYKASGKLERLRLKSQVSSDDPSGFGVPGIKGVSGQFSLDQSGGQAELSKSAGAEPAVLSFPGVFEEPDIPLNQLESTVHWQLQGHGPNQVIKVQVSPLRFANEDTAGQAKAQWQTGAGTAAQPRLPGVLDLQGQLNRANGARIYRYLPLEIGDEARHYVRDAITSGQASVVNFKVKGELDLVPFEKPGKGDFHISAQVHDVNYQYAPASLLQPGEKPWPALTKLSGELVFDRNSMAVRKARGFLGNSSVVVEEAQASIADWNKTEVVVTAKANGGLSDMLGVIKGSAIADLTQQVLEDTHATGNAKLAINLHLPTEHMDRSKVQGELALAGNSVQLMPGIPTLSQVRGSVKFSETGFSLSGLQAKALGGDVRLEGGMKPEPAASTAAPVQIRVDGNATAQGLQESKELAEFAGLTRLLQGQAHYNLQIKVRHKDPEIAFQSDLQGMGIQLPQPLGKAANSALALRVNRQLLGNSSTPGTDQINVQWGDAGSIVLERDLAGVQPKITRGSVEFVEGGKADAAASLPASGIQARVQMPKIDLDTWIDVLEKLGNDPSAGDAAGVVGIASAPAVDEAWRQYLPQQLRLKASEVNLHGRTLHDVSAQITHGSKVWNSQLDARELVGNVEYREGTPQEPAGQLIAKLSRLTVPDAQAELDLPEAPGSSLRELPALQITVEDFQLGKRSLGRVDVQARNQLLPGSAGLREWQLSRFDITTPEASLTAHGQWSLRAGDKKHPGNTQLQFQLALRDVGQLLKRFDMPGVVASGQGSLQGDISWTGSPVLPDFKTMSGAMHLDVQKGQFLKAEPGLAKLLGVLSLQSLPRRLTLDFRDVFRNGFSFDFMRGDVRIQSGIARTNNMQMKGVNAAVLMEGSADIDKETQDLHVVIVPEINALSASLVATAINPVVGLGSFLAQMILRGPLIAATTKEFKIKGSWDDPQVIELPRRLLKNTGPADEAAGGDKAAADAGQATQAAPPVQPAQPPATEERP